MCRITSRLLSPHSSKVSRRCPAQKSKKPPCACLVSSSSCPEDAAYSCCVGFDRVNRTHRLCRAWSLHTPGIPSSLETRLPSSEAGRLHRSSAAICAVSMIKLAHTHSQFVRCTCQVPSLQLVLFKTFVHVSRRPQDVCDVSLLECTQMHVSSILRVRRTLAHSRNSVMTSLLCMFFIDALGAT